MEALPAVGNGTTSNALSILFLWTTILGYCCLHRQLAMWWSLADLGGARPARAPPLRVQILSFWHAKLLKRSRLGGPRPPVRGPRPPLREILDPPLMIKAFLEQMEILEGFCESILNHGNSSNIHMPTINTITVSSCVSFGKRNWRGKMWCMVIHDNLWVCIDLHGIASIHTGLTSLCDDLW